MTKYQRKRPLRRLVYALCIFSALNFTVILVLSSSKHLFITDVSTRIKTTVEKATRISVDRDRKNVFKGAINETLTKNQLHRPIRTSSKQNVLQMYMTGIGYMPGYPDDLRNDVIKPAIASYDKQGHPMMNDYHRQDKCNNCFRHEFKYKIDNPHICKLSSKQPEIDLLILILTVHRNSLQRQTLRDTWLTYSQNNSANVRYAFLLGEVPDSKLQEKVLQESQQFGDIIKEDFIDAYTNLTYKTIMGFKWASSRCVVAKTVMKTDDDMYINVQKVINIIRRNATLLQTNVIGACTHNLRPYRNKDHHWYASVNSYPGKYYPDFCYGASILMSINIAEKIYQISPHVPFFHLEDVYVGLCLKRIGYHVKGITGFDVRDFKLDSCTFSNKTLITIHNLTPDMMRRLWHSKCA